MRIRVRVYIGDSVREINIAIAWRMEPRIYTNVHVCRSECYIFIDFPVEIQI